MDPAHAARLRAWLAAPTVRQLDASAAERLRRAADERLDDLVRLLRHGTSVCFTPPPARRVFEFDRGGILVTALAWDEAGALATACVRIPDGSWVAIEPRALTDAPWGLSDRVWHVAELSGRVPWRSGTPLTHFAALDYTRIDRIPPLAEPVRLPRGAGTALLNLVASLALDQGVERLRYGGPYPTEQLFAALLESFRYDTAASDPLARFMAGELDWMPAPHERLFDRRGACVQLRGRVEKVVAAGRVYERADWQGVGRRASRRVDDTADGVRCALWFLDTVIAEHLLLAPDGDVLVMHADVPDDRPPRPLPRAVWNGLAAVVAATSAPVLAPALHHVAEPIVAEWAGAGGDLVAVEGDRARFAHGIRTALRARLAGAATRAERLPLALAALGEMAQLVGDELRARAQALLAALPPAAQAAALEEAATAGDDGARRAREIVEAVRALAAEAGG